MNGWQAAGVFVLCGLGFVAWMHWATRTSDLDRHINEALAAANRSDCLCDNPTRPGVVHSPNQCIPVERCQCRGSLRDTSGVHHSPVVCQPSREYIGGVR